jgi:hypothetical protein
LTYSQQAPHCVTELPGAQSPLAFFYNTMIYWCFYIAEILGKGAAALAASAFGALLGRSIHRVVHRSWGNRENLC